jgi:2-polyprenyl-3-methyl-5-hydroxy-6-metoxy-1,4-benzoquinol methylase
MYQLRALDISVNRKAALDFGCGVGRLSQPLARYFDRVVGVDVSPEMTRLADEINQYPARVRYLCNSRDDLAVLPTNDFTFISNVVLQHRALDNAAVSATVPVVAPGGILRFNCPLSDPRRSIGTRVGSWHEAYRVPCTWS